MTWFNYIYSCVCGSISNSKGNVVSQYIGYSCDGKGDCEYNG